MKLEVKNLGFSYPKNQAIKDINFIALEGDIVAILGVNGVGKSTMLKCINNIHKASEGDILIDEKLIKEMKQNEIAKSIGYVSQQGQFIDGTVFENVLIGRKPFIKWNLKDKDLKEVNDAIKMVGLDELASRHIDKLSGGERQKVAICRVLAQKTPILMFDEPTSNLDMKNQIECLDVIEKIVKENNLIALISIHDLNLALRYANKFLMLKSGQVYSFGGIETINSKSIKDVYDIDVDVKQNENHTFIVVK